MAQPTTDRQIRLENAELLRGLVASVESVQTHMTEMQGQVTDIRDRVIGMEARDHEALIAALAGRVTALEGAYNRREGATTLFETALKSPMLGWAIGAIVAIWALITDRFNP